MAAVLLLAAFAGFIAKSSMTAVPLLGFIVVVAIGWNRHRPDTVEGLSFLTTVITVLILGLITVYLFIESIPIFQLMGLDIVTRDHYPFWETGTYRFSLTPMVWGTVMTTTVATLVAAPLGVGAALFISEIAPGWMREFVKPGIEIMAGVPSIVYGFLGFTVLNSYMADGGTFDLPTNGSIIVAGSVVGVMALPTVVSVAEDAIASVPDSMKDGSLAVGATDWQTMKSVTIPAAFSGVSAAIILGLGRALGETMAVAAMLAGGNVFARPLYDIFDQSATLTSRIAITYGSASDATVDVLFVAGVMLFSVIAVMSLLAQYVERGMKRKLQGDQ